MHVFFIRLLALVIAGSALAQNWQMDLEVPVADFQELFDRRTAEGYMPSALTARAVGQETRFQVTWKPSQGSWFMRTSDNAASLTAAAANFAATGYRPVFVESFGEAAVDERYASLWVHEPGMTWQIHIGLNGTQVSSTWTNLTGQGYTLHWISGNGSGSNTRFAGVWLQSGVLGGFWYGMNQAGFQNVLASNPTGRVASMSTSGAGDSKYAVVLLFDGGSWGVLDDQDRYDVELGAYERSQRGWQTTLVNCRNLNGEASFTRVERDDGSAMVWRMTGQAVPGMAAFDNAMQSFMQARNLRQGSLAVVKDGRLQVARGYTWAPSTYPDASETTTYRLASVSKPLTAIGIMKLRQQGALQLTQSVTNVLGMPAFVDAQGNQAVIRLRDLLHHRSGFDNSPDPMFSNYTISGALNVPLPISPQDIISWMQPQPLVAAPGASFAYTNFNYLLLGRVVEAVTGKAYADWMQDELFGPLGAGSMRIGRSTFDLRMRREALNGDIGTSGIYFSSVMGGTTPALVPGQYGGMNIGNLDSVGGWVGSAIDVARVVSALGSPQSPLNAASINLMFSPHPNETATDDFYVKGWSSLIDGANVRYQHNGALSTGWGNQGCNTSLAYRTDGVVWMACFGGYTPYTIQDALGAVADSVAWSATDLFPLYARARTFGQGCPGPDGDLRLRPFEDRLPTLAGRYRVVAENLGTAAWNVPVMALSSVPLPASLPLDAFGFTGCSLHVNLDVLSTMVNQGGTATYDLKVPNHSNLLGVAIYMQAAVLAPGVNPAGMVLSHGLESTVGR